MSVGDRGDGRGGAYGDLDGDGDLDLLIANCAIDAISGQGTFVALRNDAAAGHYLRVHLIGVASNRDGVGAKVQVTIGNTTQTRWTSGGDGFLSVSQRDAHFGLGQVQQIDELRITWPSGTIDVLRNVSVNQKITITEGLHP
jgi:hypothetical protein